MKFLICDDQVSHACGVVEHLQKCPEFQDSDYKIAENGLEAITLFKKNDDLDIILMDLQMPIMDGLLATKEVISINPQVKVIIITGSKDKLMLQETINSGASGYLLKENLASNLISMIKNVINGYIVFPDPSLKTKSSSTSKLSSKSERILEINKIIASKIVCIWLNGESGTKTDLNEKAFLNCFDVKPDNLIDFIIQGGSPTCNLEKELELRFNKLVSKCLININDNDGDFETELDKITAQTKYWLYTEDTKSTFSSLKSRMKANAQVLRTDCSKNIGDCIRSAFLTMPSKPCLEYLKSIKQHLKNEIENHQEKLHNYQEEENSASNSYRILRKNPEEIEASIRAIFCIYTRKMLAESVIFAIKVLQGLIRSIQIYIEDLNLSIKTLNSISELLNTSDIDETITSFVHNKFKTFQDSTKILREIEFEVQYPLNNWGIRGTDPNVIRDKLIEKISSRGGDILASIEEELLV